MKKSLLSLTAAFCLLGTACAANGSLSADSNSVTNAGSSEAQTSQNGIVNSLEIQRTAPETVPVLPYTVDLTTDEWLSAVQDFQPHKKWAVEPIGKQTDNYNGSAADENELVLKRTETERPVPPGADIPGLYFGGKDWESYTLSFDFMLGDADSISFSMYNDSLKIASDNGCTGFWFTIGADGFVRYETVDDTKLSELSELPHTDKLDKAVWHAVKLIPSEGQLKISLDGKELGNLCDITDKEYGSFGLSANDGAMFRNISVTV